MNINKHIKTRSGFTLIELLTVIAIIGILAGILIPTIGLVRKNASKAKSSSNLRQIGLAYNSFAITGPRIRSVGNASFVLATANTSASTSAEWAQVIAIHGNLNEAPLYFIDSSADAPAIIPQTIINPNTKIAIANWTTEAATNQAISYEMAVGISPNARSSITPIVWTKGYNNATASWNTGPATATAGSPWEGEGGHICFLDAHVVYYTSTGTAPTGTEGFSGGQLTRNDGTADATIQGVLTSVGGTIVTP